jgi:hypothetical protein
MTDSLQSKQETQELLPSKLWAVISEDGAVWATFDTKEKATGYPGPRMFECAPRYIVEYVRALPPTEAGQDGELCVCQHEERHHDNEDAHCDKCACQSFAEVLEQKDRLR